MFHDIISLFCQQSRVHLPLLPQPGWLCAGSMCDKNQVSTFARWSHALSGQDERPWRFTEFLLSVGFDTSSPLSRGTGRSAHRSAHLGSRRASEQSWVSLQHEVKPPHLHPIPSLGPQLEETAPLILGSFSILKTPFSAQQEPGRLPCWDQVLAMFRSNSELSGSLRRMPSPWVTIGVTRQSGVDAETASAEGGFTSHNTLQQTGPAISLPVAASWGCSRRCGDQSGRSPGS